MIGCARRIPTRSATHGGSNPPSSTTMATFTTARLRIEPVGPEDAQALFEVLADPALGRRTGEAAPTDIDEVRGRIRAWTEHEPDGQRWHNWIVRRADDGRPIGYAQATVTGRRARLAWVVRVDAQRQGYATEAATAVMAGLAGDGVTTFEATIAAGHESSEGVAWHLGMEATDEVEDGERVWRVER